MYWYLVTVDKCFQNSCNLAFFFLFEYTANCLQFSKFSNYSHLINLVCIYLQFVFSRKLAKYSFERSPHLPCLPGACLAELSHSSPGCAKGRWWRMCVAPERPGLCRVGHRCCLGGFSWGCVRRSTLSPLNPCAELQWFD